MKLDVFRGAICFCHFLLFLLLHLHHVVFRFCRIIPLGKRGFIQAESALNWVHPSYISLPQHNLAVDCKSKRYNNGSSFHKQER